MTNTEKAILVADDTCINDKLMNLASKIITDVCQLNCFFCISDVCESRIADKGGTVAYEVDDLRYSPEKRLDKAVLFLHIETALRNKLETKLAQLRKGMKL